MDNQKWISAEEWTELHALLWRRAAFLLRHEHDREDAVSRVWLRCCKLRPTGSLTALKGLLQRMLTQEATHVARQRARRVRTEISGADPAAIGLDQPAEAGRLSTIEPLVSRARALLAGAQRGWLDDLLTGVADQDLAKRDGVSVAAIRQRRCCLLRWLRSADVLEKIFDVSLTKGAEEHLRACGSGPEGSGGQVTQPPTPNPQPPTPNPQLPTSTGQTGGDSSNFPAEAFE